MKTIALFALLAAAVFAQDAPLKATISNLTADPAPYVPDDSLSYTVPLRPIEMLRASQPAVVIVPVFAAIVPFVPVDAIAYPVVAGFSFHPRPASNAGRTGHIRGRR